METLKPHSDNDHQADRRMRELYRYFRPTRSPDLNSVCSATEDTLSGAGVSAAEAAATTAALAPEALVLGNPNKTLNSFAQLAALHLDVDRALIRCVLS
jgi:hypothetical protein